jgi:Domain of unknown function (DUF1707)
LPESPGGGGVRASDEDRERVVAALKEHRAAGRLTLEELPTRVERAYAGPPSASSRSNLPFSERIEFERPVAEVETAALRSIAPSLARYGFVLVATERPNMVFVRSGLRTQRVQLTLHPLGDDRTHLRIHGTAPLALRRAFAELRE